MPSDYDLLQGFIQSFEKLTDDIPQDADIVAVCEALCRLDSSAMQLKPKVILCLSFCSASDLLKPSTTMKCRDTIRRFMDTKLLDYLISQLVPLLPRLKNERTTAAGRVKIRHAKNMLMPQLGFSSAEEELIMKWKANGGLRSIPLFHVVMTNIRLDQVSANLWWITPGILNLLDDPTGWYNLQCHGVQLLQQFLDLCADNENQALFSFAGTGLFDIYHPLLMNLFYNMPPMTDENTTKSIWSVVYPTLTSLYRAQYVTDTTRFKHMIGRLLSETFLQLIIPKLSYTNKELALQSMDYLLDIINLLGGFSIRYLQRILYVLGEYIIRSPYLILDITLEKKCLEVLDKLITVCHIDRIIAHKYDFLACILLTYEKFDAEEMADEVSNQLLMIASKLQSIGCDFANDYEVLCKNRPNLASIFKTVIDI
ncbi:HEL320Cp [Eremothecium sinecaudum]|uniref:HEL320Cp n=1 Tax=Eremothecium sinecaudum TaxID=45286 RepID=A0A0X8HT37_9SACH|nr:HEL320Cp [Eremothecium sinecaudum]AMD20961.1 HEL320Cp [Eremothecium sinecaudum]